MSEQVFRLPDVGEGLEEADIVSWKVEPGSQVQVNEIIVEIETAKSVVELPSPFAGVVTALHHPVGATVKVGEPIISIGDAAGAAPTATPAPAAASTEPEEKVEVLVGYGPSAEGSGRRRRRAAAPAASAGTAAVPAAPAATPVAPVAASAAPVTAAPVAGAVTGPVLASPPVRLLARERGIDLSAVTPTGSRGQVTRQDVLDHVAAPVGPAAATAAPVDLGDGIIRTPIRGVRKATAAAMVASKFTAPHVTEFLTVDVTGTLDLVQRLRGRKEFAGLSVTPLLVVAKALTATVAAHPEINASWDEQAQEIVQYRDVNLGIAAATPRGLLVPNIKGAQAMSFLELSRALTDLIATAREGKTSPAQMAGGTITITNIGSFGVDAGTPILNPGEAAILCMGAVRKVPWVVDDEVVVRSVMTLSLSFDHRLVDGELGSKVLAHVGAVLRDPLWELTLA